MICDEVESAEQWIMDCGLSILDSGFWIVDSGLWIVDYGLWVAVGGMMIFLPTMRVRSGLIPTTV
jgi:hypothetical protein